MELILVVGPFRAVWGASCGALRAAQQQGNGQVGRQKKPMAFNLSLAIVVIVESYGCNFGKHSSNNLV